jgi:crotonobetaine/carnitine-CoA ligase
MTSGPPPGLPVRRAARVVLLDPAGRVLLLRYDQPPPNGRHWATPGGGLEPGEDPQTAGGTHVAVPPGQVGEFWIHGVAGRTLMAGYLDDPEATAAALRPDGSGRGCWLRTHDTGYADAQGWFFFVDRSRNVIKRAGENISATEIETVLTAHPLIADAAVIGVPDPVRDKMVKAFVQPVPGAGLDAADVQAYCREHLAEYKVPGVVELVDDFPRTSSMKIQKRCLH